MIVSCVCTCLLSCACGACGGWGGLKPTTSDVQHRNYMCVCDPAGAAACVCLRKRRCDIRQTKRHFTSSQSIHFCATRHGRSHARHAAHAAARAPRRPVAQINENTRTSTHHLHLHSSLSPLTTTVLARIESSAGCNLLALALAISCGMRSRRAPRSCRCSTRRLVVPPTHTRTRTHTRRLFSPTACRP